MLRQALLLWRQEKHKKGTSLQHRLILFFVCVTVFLVLAFTIMLLLFGITGKEEKVVQSYVGNELDHISAEMYENFGRISVLGVQLSENIADSCEDFFSANKITAMQIADSPDLIEPLLSEQMKWLINATDSTHCGGAFMMLDATVAPEADNARYARAGIFIKKTRSVALNSIGLKKYCLRGPAQIARDNGIELLGQWKMEYDVRGEEFFDMVMQTARNNIDMPLSRLYYWTGSVTLKDNSESGFLLCVPLRNSSGEVFGVCGIEVSDRTFKQFYTPNEGQYSNVFAVAAKTHDDLFKASSGLIAGNYYLTGNRISTDLAIEKTKNSFVRLYAGDNNYGGMIKELKLYPSGSAYEFEKWNVAVMMPEEILDEAIDGNSAYLILIVLLLLIISLVTSVFISRRYLQPVTNALDSIRNNTYDGEEGAYLEISALFESLAQKDKEYEDTLKELENARVEADKAKQSVSRLADKRRDEIDEDYYEHFISKLHTLTPKEREVFELYLDGRSTKEILEILDINENTLKYHNRNIYGKLGVSSRKQLLTYAALMKHDRENRQ